MRRKLVLLSALAALGAGCQGRITDQGGSATGGGAPGSTVTTPHPPATTSADQMRIDQMMQAANPDLFLTGSAPLLALWKQETLDSEEARREFLLPDV